MARVCTPTVAPPPSAPVVLLNLARPGSVTSLLKMASISAYHRHRLTSR
jgi:hypothetical protein